MHKLELLAVEQRKDKEYRDLMADSSAQAGEAASSKVDSALLDKLSTEKDKLALDLATLNNKYGVMEGAPIDPYHNPNLKNNLSYTLKSNPPATRLSPNINQQQYMASLKVSSIAPFRCTKS